MVKQLFLLVLTLNYVFISAADSREQAVPVMPNCSSLAVLTRMALICNDYSLTSHKRRRDLSETATSSDNTKRTRFNCCREGCTASFANNSNLRKHIKAAHEGIRFSCTFGGCSRVFRSAYGLKVHTGAIHQDIRLNCPEEGCGRHFAYETDLRRHKKMHKEGYVRPSQRSFRVDDKGSITEIQDQQSANDTHVSEQQLP